MNKQKGFTIIELIVVIAIIAVLAAIVLVNVTQYIAKGKDSSIKGNMSSMATISAAFYDDSTKGAGSFLGGTGLEADPTFAAGVLAINTANPGTSPTGDAAVEVTASAWCIESALNTTADGPWCVDSSGFKGKVTAGACDATNANCVVEVAP